MNKILGVLLLSVALALPFLPPAQAACPAGSPAGINCENYQGQVLDSVTGGTAQRKDQDRFNDHGVNIKEFGAIGDGNSHRLSGIYANLAAAQAVYPFVSDLTQEVDWAATQAAINYSYQIGTGSVGTQNQNVYCPSASGNSYQLSLPLEVNSPNNYGQAAQWASGTTYANNADVTYNGLSWTSMGSGNVGNPPTAADGYPASLQIAGAQRGLATATISDGSPAVITVTGHGLVVGQPLVFYPQTYSNFNVASPALPSGLNANQVYYVIATGLGTNTFEVSATPGGSAVNTSSAGSGVFSFSTAVWNVRYDLGGDFNRSNFIGDPGRASGQGCRYVYYPKGGTAFIVGPGNGNLIQSVSLQANDDYRCSNYTSLVAFGNTSFNAGSHGTVYDKVGADGFYIGFGSDAGGGNGTLGDSNVFYSPHLSDSCVGIAILSEENFINNVFDGLVDSNTTAAQAEVGAGLKLYGGNYSTSSNQATQFTLTNVSSSSSNNQFFITATVSNPDSFLNNPFCGYNLQCVYSTFEVVTTLSGVVPLSIIGYNPTTAQITLQVNSDFTSPYQNNLNSGNTTFADQLAAVTSVYAAEVIRPFSGQGIQAQQIHIENGVATTLVDGSTAGFGSANADILQGIYSNAIVPLGDPLCCNNNGVASTKQIANFYAQDNIPFINAARGVIIDNIQGGGTQGDQSRALIEGGNIEWRNFGGQNNGTWPVQTRGAGNANQLTGGYGSDNNPAFGLGYFDNNNGDMSAALNDAGRGPRSSWVPDYWRFKPTGWGWSPAWGVRPAPYASPCITPALVTALGSPSSITYTSSLDYVNGNGGGTNYQQGDILTVTGGTGTAAQIKVQQTGAGGSITAAQVTVNGSYTVEPSGTLSVTGGHGSSASFAFPFWYVNYAANYPLLFGGTIYHVCDAAGGSQTKYALASTNTGYSYFQDLTISNVPNLSWSSRSDVPAIYMNQEALELMFPGLVISLTPSGGVGCSGTETFVVTEVHPTAAFDQTGSGGYIMVLDIENPGSTYLPHWGVTPVCTGTTIGQAATNLVNPY